MDSWIIGGDCNNARSMDDSRADVRSVLSSISCLEQDVWDRLLLYFYDGFLACSFL